MKDGKQPRQWREDRARDWRAGRGLFRPDIPRIRSNELRGASHHAPNNPVTLPPKALNVLVDLKKELLDQAPALPSAEDLDAVAEEERIKTRTARLEPKGSKDSCFYSMRHARGGNRMSYQRFRSRELQRIARA
jgi:hypothetical protein